MGTAMHPVSRRGRAPIALAAVLTATLISSAALAEDAPAKPTDDRDSRIRLLETQMAKMAAEITSLRTEEKAMPDQIADQVRSDAAKRDPVFMLIERNVKLGDVPVAIVQAEDINVYPTRDIPSFVYQAPDSNLAIRGGAMGQFRGIVADREPLGTTDSDIEDGFELSRVKGYLAGNLGTDWIDWRVQGQTTFGSTGGSGAAALEDAFVNFRVNDNLALRVGQTKDLVNHEYSVFSGYQLAIERSLALEFLGAPVRVQGIFAHFGEEESPFRAAAGIHGGFGDINTRFTNADPNCGISGRAEYKLQGDWNDYVDFTAARTDQNLFVVGAGADITWDGDTTMVAVAADAAYETAGGLSLFGGLYIDPSRFDGNNTFSIGGVAQAGYYLDNRWEPFGRLSVVSFDDDRVGVGMEDLILELNGGVNYYPLEGDLLHRVKLSADIAVLPDGSPATLPLLNYVASTEFQALARFQVQIAF